MTPPQGAAPGGLRGLRTVWQALAAMTAVQAVASMIVITVPLFAVTAAPEIGVDARVVGFYSALIYMASTVSAPIGGYFTDRIGPARTSQICMLAAMLGIALVATAQLPLVALGALLIGAGNGPPTPASTYILSRRTPPTLLSLVLSIKQTGASVGTAVAGIAVPLMVAASGWRSAALACAGIALALALGMEWLRRDLDRDAVAERKAAVEKRPAAFAGMLAGLGLIARSGRLAVLGLCAFSFAMPQIAITSYFVTYLVGEIGLDKTAAGFHFSVAVTAAIVARIVMGALADRIGDRKLVLIALGIGMAASALGFMLLTRDSPAWAIGLVGIVFACSSMTWSSVFLAETVPFAPRGQTGTLIGAMMIFIFVGSIVGPGLFGLIVTTTGSYKPAFIAVGVPALLSAIAFIVMLRNTRTLG